MPREFFLPIRHRGIRLLSLLLLAAVLFLPACKYDSADVEWTIPGGGDSEVLVQPVIAVRLTNTMTASDFENTALGSITVTGDQTAGEYSGTIVAANEQDVFLGQTITEFQTGVTQLPDLGNPLDLEPETEDAGDNTLVFLLNPLDEFKPGERITVTVSEDVTVLGVPFSRPYVFSFTVKGGGARSEGGLFVRETLPLQASGSADLRPAVTAHLSENISAGTETDAVRVSGSQSGIHSGGIVQLNQDGEATSLTHVLGAADSFLPGEEVNITFSSDIAASDAVRLSPYQLTFQVRPGFNKGGWEARSLQPLAPDGAVAVLAADFLKDSGAVEMVTVSSTIATLYDSSGRRGTVEAAGGWIFLDAVAVDAEGKGTPQIVALLEGPLGEFRLQEYEVDSSGGIFATDSQLDFATAQQESTDNYPGRLYVADLDSDGQAEIIATHADAGFDGQEIPGFPGGLGDFGGLGDLGGLGLPVAQEEEQTTGYMTIFQLVMGLPAGGFNLNDPENLLELQFIPVRGPISSFDPSARLQFVDLDNDGRLDLVSEVAGGASAGTLVLYRNQTTTSNPFSFRRVGTLKDGDGADFIPDNWIAFDFETDGDLDVLSWKSGEAYLHQNSYRDIGSFFAGGLGEEFLGGLGLEDLDSLGSEESRGLLFEDVVPQDGIDVGGAVAGKADRLQASNLDGDLLGGIDLVIAGPGDAGQGRLTILFNRRDKLSLLPSYEKLEMDNGEAGIVSGFALLDLDGDTGLDIATVSNDEPLVYESRGVEAVTLPEPTRYTLQPVDENGVDISVEDLSELESDVVFGIKVIGDLRAPFAGYSIALAYQQVDLDYLGFLSPPGFEQSAQFETCPQDGNDNTCSGFATATMTKQSDIGFFSPFDDVDLGVFRFRRRQVLGQRNTRIEFSSTSSGGVQISNILKVVEADISQDVPVETGEAIEFELEPPPPAPIEVTCSVMDRGATSSEVLISWQSQILRFDRVKIRIADGPPTYIDWDNGFFVTDVSTPGNVSISVAALSGDSDVGPTVICGVVHVPQPSNVACQLGNETNIVTWDWGQEAAAEEFRIYRNGSFWSTVAPSSGLIFEDFFPSEDGSDFYEVSAIIDGFEGSRGGCSGNDPDPCNTEEPIRSPLVGTLLSRASPSAPQVIRWSWINGEAYNGMTAGLLFQPADLGSPLQDLFGQDGIELPNPNQEFLLYEGDPDRGGAATGTYTLTLTASKKIGAGQNCGGLGPGFSVESDTVAFLSFTLDAPDIAEVGLSCLKDSGGIEASWSAPWRGYGEGMLTLELSHIIDGEEAGVRVVSDILPSDTGHFFDSVEPVGSYRVSLRAVQEETSCQDIEYLPHVSVGSTVAAVGEASFEIPLVASGISGDIESIEFDLVIAETVSILEPALAAGVSLGDGMKRIEVRDGDLSVALAVEQSDGSGMILATLEAALPADLPAEDVIRLENVRIRFGGFETLRSVESSDGRIEFANSYLKLATSAAADDDEVFDVVVRGSLRAPAEIPGYAFNAFNIHLQFDPGHLELLPVDSQQAGTIAEGLGQIFLPSEASLPDINTTGDLNICWVNFNFSALESNPLPPFENGEVLNLRFRSKVPGDAPRTLTAVSFVVDPNVFQPTAFFPEQAVPGRPVIDSFFDASLELGGEFPLVQLHSISPATGPFTGGNEVKLSGSGLDGDGEHVPQIRLLPSEGEGDILAVPPGDVIVMGSDSVSFVVPDSLGPRPAVLPSQNSVRYDVELTVGAQVVSLGEAYSVEAPSLAGVDVSSLRAECGDFIEVRGTGFSNSTVVKLEVEGREALVAEHFARSGRPAVANDGRSMLVRAPEAGLLVADEAFVLVEVLDPFLPAGEAIETMSLPTPLEIIAGDCPEVQLQPNLIQVNLLQPETVSVCGGSHVDIFGNGFTARSEVFVDGVEVESQGFVFHSAQHLSFLSPGRAAAGEARLFVRDPVTVIQSEVVLNYELPPQFIRGDVDGDRQVTDSDATLLSSLLFGGAGNWPENRDAADLNDDGHLNFGDLMDLLNYLQDTGEVADNPPAPFPALGPDPTEDDICQ